MDDKRELVDGLDQSPDDNTTPMDDSAPDDNTTPMDDSAPDDETVVVGPEGIGKRLDVFLSKRFPTWSRNFWHDVIARGGISVERDDCAAGRVLPSRRLLEYDRITIDKSYVRQEDPHPFIGKIEIVYETETFIGANKPPGLLSHPAGLFGTGSLIDKLKERFGMLHLCGRLDRFTSGLVLLARDKSSLTRVEKIVEENEAHKYYLALVEGNPAQEKGFINEPIGSDEHSSIRLKMAIVKGGKASRTEYETLAKNKTHSLLRVRLHTGRKHQIRVHLAHIGCPIVGDKLYGKTIDYQYFTPGRGNLHSYWPGWHALHCYQMQFPKSTVAKEETTITAPVIGPMRNALQLAGFKLEELLSLCK